MATATESVRRVFVDFRWRWHGEPDPPEWTAPRPSRVAWPISIAPSASSCESRADPMQPARARARVSPGASRDLAPDLSSPPSKPTCVMLGSNKAAAGRTASLWLGQVFLLTLLRKPVHVAQISPLRVLVANERKDRLELLARVVTDLGHEVIAREVDVKEVGAVTAREHPDVAFVGLGLSSKHALELIGEIVQESKRPVIALLSAKDPSYIREAAKRGVFAYIVDADAEELQSGIETTLLRAGEVDTA